MSDNRKSFISADPSIVIFYCCSFKSKKVTLCALSESTKGKTKDCLKVQRSADIDGPVSE